MIKPFPVVELEHIAAADRFERWAAQFGIARLGRSLGVQTRTVRLWAHSSVRPDNLTAKRIIVLSRLEPLDGGPLTYEDLYGPALAASVTMRTVKKVQAWE